MANKPKEINAEQVKKMASLGSPLVDIAYVVGCSVDTLQRRFRDEIEEGRATGRTRLRQKQLEVAMQGNPAMLIWLGKQLLGQTDKQEISADINGKQKIKLDWGTKLKSIESDASRD